MTNTNLLKVKTCLIAIFFFISGSSLAQLDSLPNGQVSINAFTTIFCGEVGFYYDMKISPLIQLRVSYGHRFYQPNIIKNGGTGWGVQYYPAIADIVRVGAKKYFRKKGENTINSYFILGQAQLIHTNSRKYTTRNGSNGSDEIDRWVKSVERNMIGGAIGGGKTLYKDERFYSEIFFLTGFARGNKVETIYSRGNSGSGNEVDVDPDEVYRAKGVMPILEFGLLLGYCW